MKVSIETISILNSFASINPVMYFGDPKAVKVIRTNGTFIGVFQPEEKFDKDCAFWEMPQLLAVINSMGGELAELNFNESYVTITNTDGAHVNYMYTPKSVLASNYKEPKPFEAYCKPLDVAFSFDITAEHLTKLFKLAKIMNLNTMQFVFENNKGKINLLDATNSSVGHTFDMNIEGNGSGNISFEINNLTIINGDYHIEVQMKNNIPICSKWTNKNIPLFYIAAAKK